MVPQLWPDRGQHFYLLYSVQEGISFIHQKVYLSDRVPLRIMMFYRSVSLITIFLLVVTIIMNQKIIIFSLNISSQVHVKGTFVPGEKLSCPKEISKIGFMKTHKTASSTVQNILMRFGLNSNLNFAMLSEGTHLGPPKNQYTLNQKFSRTWLQGVPWKAMTETVGYDIFALHTKWDQKEVESVLGPGAKYVTILRDPVTAFESLYNYMHFHKKFKMDIETFVEKFISKNNNSEENYIPRINGYLGRNQQLWDLGLEDEELKQEESVKAKIKQIDEQFDLVMIAEDFDSSTVLLGKTLCWPLVNLTSMQLNARKKSKIHLLTNKAISSLKSWLWADYMLYNFFRNKLEEKKTEYGRKKLEEDVVKLQELNTGVKKKCLIDVVEDTKKLEKDFIPWSNDVQGIKIQAKIPKCKFYGIGENQFIEYLRKLQLQRFYDWASRQKD